MVLSSWKVVLMRDTRLDMILMRSGYQGCHVQLGKWCTAITLNPWDKREVLFGSFLLDGHSDVATRGSREEAQENKKCVMPTGPKNMTHSVPHRTT